MILSPCSMASRKLRKPRASGDDPVIDWKVLSKSR